MFKFLQGFSQFLALVWHLKWDRIESGGLLSNNYFLLIQTNKSHVRSRVSSDWRARELMARSWSSIILWIAPCNSETYTQHMDHIHLLFELHDTIRIRNCRGYSLFELMLYCSAVLWTRRSALELPLNLPNWLSEFCFLMSYRKVKRQQIKNMSFEILTELELSGTQDGQPCETPYYQSTSHHTLPA